MTQARLPGLLTVCLSLTFVAARGDEPDAELDHIAQLQAAATRDNRSPSAHWGADPDNYRMWSSHSNRLIPVYTFGTLGAGDGIDLTSCTGANSRYRDPEKIRDIYGQLPGETWNPAAEYCDQTDLYLIQRAALEAGRKHIFLVVFDGMDWQTTRAAAIARTRSVAYDSGRGQGLHFQDYTAGGSTQFGFMVTSPHNEGTDVDVNLQTVTNPNGKLRGGYSALRGGPNPWTPGLEPLYLISRPEESPLRHAYTDSSSSASSMTAGIKTYNNAVNVDELARQVRTIAHEAQEAGCSVGAVTSVPISHATPAAAYAHNVERDDYQDLTRDLIGLPSIAHPFQPLPGLDVLIGCGYGVTAETTKNQGDNFVPGNIYLTDADRLTVDVAHGGRYVVTTRQAGRSGAEALSEAAQQAIASRQRLLGFFGTASGHLPYATANGDYRPVDGKSEAEKYTEADLHENPTLSEMTSAAISVLSRNPRGFWLMMEPGDVDWANHNNNIDDSIGAVHSGDAAVKVITDWVDAHSNWQESLLIVTADHGHYLVLTRPEDLIDPADAAAE
ncbi:MAG: alkaline phosphatase [Planctomyces sp.]|nr:alkaline phosphatase [Planctomyces sp.]